MKRRYLSLVLPLIILAACSSSNDANKEGLGIKPKEELQDANYKIDMYFAKQPYTKNVDTLFLRFRITDNSSNKKVFWSDLKKESFEIRESGGNPPDRDVIVAPITLREDGQAERISQNAVFWLLVDRGKTISNSDMESMKTAIRQTIENLPDSCTYISFFDRQTSEKKLLTKENFAEFEKEFKVKPETRELYQNIIGSFEKFAKDQAVPSAAKYLLIFTDGKIEMSMAEIDKMDQSDQDIKKIDNLYQNQVYIYAFRYGEKSSLVDKTLNDICSQRSNPGGYYPANNVAGIVDSLRGFVNNLSADYELTLVNNNGKSHNGTKLSLQVILKNGDETAVGEIQYAPGSPETILTTGPNSNDIYVVAIFGIIILFIAFFIMQAGIPYIMSRTANFEKKYVKPYEPITTSEGEVYETCAFCQEPLERGDLIVVKCSHKTHWDCWKENGHKCVEYGQNCKDGIQFHFDSKHPFDLKKSPYYLKWAMSGMISGFLIWIIFDLSKKMDFVPRFIDALLKIFYPERLKEAIEGVVQIPSATVTGFHTKITGLMLAGVLLGFVLTFLFSYINDFRQKTKRVLFAISFRALIGAIVGLLAFLIGSILFILIGKTDNIWLNVIPWLLFGGSIALSIAIKTTIKWQDALIGGLISGVVSFLILCTTYYLGSIGVMIGFILCSAGLGISIVARHHLAQKYFLKYSGGKRKGEIAIHKWMNESGGSNEVTIGKSNRCIIQMNWDDSENIQDMQAKLYIDPKRKIPTLKIIESGMIYDGRDGRRDEVYLLKNNVKFKIGDTEFQYIEK
jgi:hypothetical protein